MALLSGFYCSSELVLSVNALTTQNKKIQYLSFLSKILFYFQCRVGTPAQGAERNVSGPVQNDHLSGHRHVIVQHPQLLPSPVAHLPTAGPVKVTSGPPASTGERVPGGHACHGL